MGETIQLTAADGHTLDTYLARPPAAPRGGVVVVQEIFGVNSHIRAVCDRFAAAGYLAVAPAIYDRIERDVQLGYAPEDIARGRDIRGKCAMEDVLRDVAAAAEKAAEAGKVGIVGYCWGGLIVYVAACRMGDKLSCASGYYGGNIVSYLNEKPAVPLILHFGALDASIPMADIDRIRAAHPDMRVHVYEGADHGFNCDQRRQFNDEAARIAQRRTLDLFATHLA
ncbi:MAG TPA: dienelactone hydrolase family protein [Kiloniellales bacterium]